MNNPKLEMIALRLIDGDVSNHRLLEDAAADKDLAESVAQVGIKQPIKVNRKDDGRYTIVFGHRRRKAALTAELAEIPAIVAEGMTEAEIRAEQAIENIKRKDLHPLEEAKFCADMAETLADEYPEKTKLVETLAQRLGRSRTWVDHRLNMSRLSPRVEAAFLAGDIHLQHAQLISRLVDHDAQDEVLGGVSASECTWLDGRERQESRRGPASISETRFAVESRLRTLKDAAWDLAAEFDGKIACDVCPHNAANRGDLFDTDQPKDPICLDARCFQEKSRFVSLAIRRATNTLLKTTDKPGSAGAKKAIAEREVTFVKPKAVVEAAKRRIAPDEPTAAERGGAMDWQQRHRVDCELRERMRGWLEPALDGIMEKMPRCAEAVAIIELVDSTRLVAIAEDGRGAQRKQAREDFGAILDLLPGLDEAKQQEKGKRLLAAVARIAAYLPDPAENQYRRPFDLRPWDDSPFTRQRLCELFSVKPEGKKPTRSEIEKELFPKPAKNAAGKKKASKKKASKKGSAA